MKTTQSTILKILGLLLILSIGTSALASVSTHSTNVSQKEITKVQKKQDRYHKKAAKIQQRIQKAKIKAGAENMSDSEFLEGADDRVRFGLIGILGGILLLLILRTSLRWIGTIALVAGIALIIWHLIEA